MRVRDNAGARKRVRMDAFGILLVLVCALVFAAPSAYASEGGQTMWRVYNPGSGEYFYTSSESEMRDFASLGWRMESVGQVAQFGDYPVYRLCNPNSGEHHYTPSAGERDALEAEGWVYEGVGWMPGGIVRLLCLHNSSAQTDTQSIANSTDAALRSALMNGQTTVPFWVNGPGNERMRVLADGSLATGRFEADGAAYWGKPGTGWIVRGAWLAPEGNIVRAGSDGVLREGSLTGDAELDTIVDDYIRANTGTGADALRRLYDSMSVFEYIDGGGDEDWESWCVPYALEFWHDGGGNCYRYAAFSYWLARGLGYDDAVIRVGKVAMAVGFSWHAWVEIPNEEGVPCVFDPEVAYDAFDGEVDLFMVPYPETPLMYYTLDEELIG